MSSKTTILNLAKPDLNDKVGTTIEDLAKNFESISCVWPIGAVLISTRSDNPSTYLGGTWQQIQGRMLIGQSPDFPAGTTGGEKEHTLTVNEMPSHDHKLRIESQGGGEDIGLSFKHEANASYTNSGHINYTGGGAAHNNMPPYKSVYIWERVA